MAGALGLGAAALVWTWWATDEGERADDGPRDPVGEHVDLSEAGFHDLPPVPGRPEGAHGGIRVWTGDELVVWGGVVGAPDGEAAGRTLDVGATLAIDEGRWRPMPASPFVRGLYEPMGAWDGTEVIVVGTSCEADIPPASAGPPPSCPDGPAAAAYDPATATWRRLDPPPIPVDPAYDAEVLRPEEVLGGDGHVAFAFVGRARLLTWDRASGSWDLIDPPPGSEDAAVDACVDPVTATMAAVRPPVHARETPAWTYQLGEAAWLGPVEIPAGLEWGIGCADGEVVAARWDEAGSRGHAYDLATGEPTLLDPDSPRMDWKDPKLIGPWLLVESRTPAEGEDRRLRTTYEVRRIDGDRWVEVEAPDGLRFWAGVDTYLDGIGILADAVTTGDPDLVLWRAPEGLIS